MCGGLWGSAQQVLQWTQTWRGSYGFQVFLEGFRFLGFRVLGFLGPCTDLVVAHGKLQADGPQCLRLRRRL